MTAKSLGDYVLLKNKIGSGSFADVYPGYRKEDKLHVAIKVIPKEKLNEKLEQSLEFEIRTLKSFDHENIIKLYDVYRSKRHIYLVMEYCAGGDLASYIKAQKGPLPEKIVKRFLRDLVSGLKYINDRNLVHRDLKPQNLLLTSKDSNARVKIADFGFARSLMQNDMANTMCGSPLYMGPEVLEGKKYNAKADLWSVGAILFEMLTGKPPYIAMNIIQLIKMIKSTPLQLPIHSNPDVLDLLQGLLQIDPKRRFSFKQFFEHPYVRSCFEEKQTQPVPIPAVNTDEEKHQFEVKSSQSPQLQSSISPPRPQINPFGDTVQQPSPKEIVHNEEKDYVMINSEERFELPMPHQSLSSLVKTSESGHLTYPSVIFDFSELQCNKTSDQYRLVLEVEERAKTAWYIAEFAFLLDKTHNKELEALALYIRVLDLMHKTFKYAKANVNNSQKCDRLRAVLIWIQQRYMEFLDRAEKLKSRLNVNESHTVIPEELLYSYALKLAKEAAFDEYLHNLSNCESMYRRCKALFAYLAQNENLSNEDKKILRRYITYFDKRLEIGS